MKFDFIHGNKNTRIISIRNSLNKAWVNHDLDSRSILTAIHLK